MCKKPDEKISHPLIRSLMNPECFDHPVRKIRLIETHISWVILTGTYAYKLKKPLNLDFLDFSTLSCRRFFCEEELRLNQRLAPNLYLSVEPITGSIAHPRFNGPGEPIEYAVKMKEFSQQAQLDRMLARGRLKTAHVDALAHMIAHFHQNAAIAGKNSHFGESEQVPKPVMENFIQIRKHIDNPSDTGILDELEKWIQLAIPYLMPTFAGRKAGVRIRECHGDLHLKNLAWLDRAPVAFDCIEFSPDLRWIDVMNDIAFLVMDLLDRSRSDLAWRFLNRYLEDGGDYEGISVLTFYLVYRAMVRAKVHALRKGQPGISSMEQTLAEKACHDYLCLACQLIQNRSTPLIITHGASASGKSTLTQPILEQLGAIRIRSDVERKRLHGIDPCQSARASHGNGIYSNQATRRTFDHLARLAGLVIDAGYPVIMDAAFLNRNHRNQFQNLADEKQVPFIILDFRASPDELRRRIVDRSGDVSDADLSILEHQLTDRHPLSETELSHVISIDTQTAWNPLLTSRQIAARSVTIARHTGSID